MVKRINACPSKCKNCTSREVCSHSKFGVLFSGGLDSTVIALFLSKCLPSNESIDLLNVSFGNGSSSSKGNRKKKEEKDAHSRPEINFTSPDRISALASLKELQAIDKSRIWNFVEINITAEELRAKRDDLIHHLIAPHSSVLDDSIGCALYFCGRGEGLLNGKMYSSPSRVIFSGLGADEQLGGYSRHRGRFSESGWSGLLEELDLEMGRIHSRNCGRDDRVLSHHGRTARFPYLDEGVVSFLNSLPIWTKANL
ncbi:UNVERIFIED_CONTAM: hypothetical protein GTU68_011839, partial [Idotea baltica]|nr:hypothetical protein [Idotea baltica]